MRRSVYAVSPLNEGETSVGLRSAFPQYGEMSVGQRGRAVQLPAVTACAVRAIFLSLLQGDAFTCKASPLPKQSTGLF